MTVLSKKTKKSNRKERVRRINEENRARHDKEMAVDLMAVWRDAKGKDEEDRMAKMGAYRIMGQPAMEQAKALAEVLRLQLQENGKDLAGARNVLRLLALELERAGIEKKKIAVTIAKMVNRDWDETNDDMLGLKENNVRKVLEGRMRKR